MMPKLDRDLNSESPNVKRQPQIVIANDLRSGITVFLTTGGEWSEHVTEALVVTDDNGASDALATAASAESANRVTGAYLADSNKQGAPLVLREFMRVHGPSIDYMPKRDLASRVMNAPVQAVQIQTTPIHTTPIHTTPIHTKQGEY